MIEGGWKVSSNVVCPYAAQPVHHVAPMSLGGGACRDVITLEHTPHTNACAFGGGCSLVPHERQVTGVRITYDSLVVKINKQASKRRRTLPQMHLESG